MDFSRLEKNMVNVIREEQIKIGYRHEVIRLYYPLQSLNRFLKTDYSEKEMQNVLQEYFETGEGVLGTIQVSGQGDRFCFLISEEAVDYVHEQTPQKEFLRDFISVIEKHDCSIEDLLHVFHEYSPNVHFETVLHGEFQYLIYFEDGVPDDFRYCITDEGCHMIYHRFTPEDYEDFGF